MKLEIGDIVRQAIWGQEGQIITEYENYWEVQKEDGQFITRNPSSWLQEQTVPFSDEEINEQRWFSVHCFNGGSILCCEGKLEFVSRIDAQGLANACPTSAAFCCGPQKVRIKGECKAIAESRMLQVRPRVV